LSNAGDSVVIFVIFAQDFENKIHLGWRIDS